MYGIGIATYESSDINYAGSQIILRNSGMAVMSRWDVGIYATHSSDPTHTHITKNVIITKQEDGDDNGMSTPLKYQEIKWLS